MENQDLAPVAKTAGGGSKVALIIIGVVIVLALGGVAVYARYFAKPGSILSGIVPKALNPNCKYNDPDLCKFMNRWPNVSDLSMSSKATLGGKTYESIFKMNGKNRDEMSNKTDGKEDYHTISIDKTSYVLDYTDSKWWKYTQAATDSSAIKETEDLVDFNSAEDKSTYKKIGQEACSNLTCFKYQVLDPANTETTEYIYFDNKEYLLRKTRSETKDGSVLESIVEYGSVSISAPSPTKDGNPYSAGATSIPTTTPSTSTPSSSGAGSVQTPATDNSVNDTPADTSGDVPVDTAPSDSGE